MQCVHFQIRVGVFNSPRESTTFWPLWWRVSLSIKLYTTLNHIRFVFYHKETTPTRIWKCTRCIMQMSCLYASDFPKLLQTRLICRNNSEKCLGKEWWHVLVIDKSTYREKPHFDLFFTTISTTKKMFFFRARAEKGRIAWHIDASSVVETLIYHGISQGAHNLAE